MDRNDGIYKNLLELVGQTPMVQLNVITKDFPGNYFAKLEMFNPGQSQKDRIALHIVENAEKKGILKPGSTICRDNLRKYWIFTGNDSNG